jgi:3-oxoacyl-[acyl-carrier-protein] synthase III
MLFNKLFTGNVSSSTTWYTLGFIESMRGVRKGDTVLQVGVGSGVKCGINVWKVRKLNQQRVLGGHAD